MEEQHLCDTCSYHIATCPAKEIVWVLTKTQKPRVLKPIKSLNAINTYLQQEAIMLATA